MKKDLEANAQVSRRQFKFENSLFRKRFKEGRHLSAEWNKSRAMRVQSGKRALGERKSCRRIIPWGGLYGPMWCWYIIFRNSHFYAGFLDWLFSDVRTYNRRCWTCQSQNVSLCTPSPYREFSCVLCKLITNSAVKHISSKNSLRSRSLARWIAKHFVKLFLSAAGEEGKSSW